MNNDYRMLEWMSAALADRSVSEIPSDQWPEFYENIDRNGLLCILFPIVHRMMSDDGNENQMYSKWRYEIIQKSLQRLHNVQKIRELTRAFKDNNIPLLIIKGPAIARLYSRQQCRVMADLDILVEGKNFKQAGEILEDMGYHHVIKEKEREHPVHEEYKKAGGLYLELHKCLLNPLFLGQRNTEKWYKSIWEHSQTINYEGIEFEVMSSEDELINQVLHLATHLVYGSVNISNIYDIALLIKNFGESLKWEYVKETLGDLRLETFSRLIFSVCKNHLGMKIPDGIMAGSVDNLPISEEEFLNRFVFINAADHKGSKKGWRVISWKYPYLCKHTYGIPFVFIIELYFELKRNIGNLKLSFANSISNTREFRFTGKTLERLGLSHKMRSQL